MAFSAGPAPTTLPVNVPATGEQARPLLLAGKLAMVTGASRGIGRAVAEAFAREGAGLILCGRDTQALEEVAKACTSRGAHAVHIVPAALDSAASVDAMAKRVLADHGGVDVLVNNAGMATRAAQPPAAGESVFTGEDPLAGNPDAWDCVLALNLQAPMRLTRAFAPGMAAKGAGAIINICSIAGLEAMARAPVYCASKWGLRGWGKSCYQALRPHGIKVSTISPGLVDTAMTGWHKGERSMFIQPEDIAQAALLVCRMSHNAVPEEIVVRTCVPVEGT